MASEVRCCRLQLSAIGTLSQADAGFMAELMPRLIDDDAVIGAEQLDTQPSNQRLTLQIILRDGPLASERERIMGLRRYFKEIR
jgi:hypothetical protein